MSRGQTDARERGHKISTSKQGDHSGEYKPNLRGKCCWARDVVILDRCSGRSRTEGPLPGYVGNKKLSHQADLKALGFSRAVQSLEKRGLYSLLKSSPRRPVLKGHGFQPCRKSRKINRGFTRWEVSLNHLSGCSSRSILSGRRLRAHMHRHRTGTAPPKMVNE
jgi:hypothetical protein